MENTATKKFLIIQNASIGDVILATSMLEKLYNTFPQAFLGMIVNKGSEGLFEGHPYLNKLYVQDKKNHKYKNLRNILKEIRKEHYDYCININRFGSAGILCAFSKAKIKIGFDKSPFSFLYNIRVKHQIGIQWPTHEVSRNQQLIESIAAGEPGKVKLYPADNDFSSVAKFKNSKYITIAPLSLWFTKQYPTERWIEFLGKTDPDLCIYILGSQKDKPELEQIFSDSPRKNLHNLAGELTLLQTAALMKDAVMNFTNDSAPLHLASAMNAKVTAIFCSTVPEFGFGPLSMDSLILQSEEKLKCRPCGIHGLRECPMKNMACGYNIPVSKLIERIKYD
jgi:ADP-heptose:LPS heptosyltransferase